MNAAVAARWPRYSFMRYVGPVCPPVDYWAKCVSKARRMTGLPGAFHYFSKKRLDQYARAVSDQCDPGAGCDFFHGITPWVCCQVPRPYHAYTDACFLTYLQLYHRSSDFSAGDVHRIAEAEKAWLANAQTVFFSSDWSLRETKRHYELPGRNFLVAGVGGALDIPKQDTFGGNRMFLAVVTDFERKGGRISFDAFRIVKERHPDASLTYVGVKPPDDILAFPGVSSEGYLRKSVPTERARLTDLFAQSFALLLPSSGDTTPIIIAEVGYFGCPTIAPSRFGIPEMVKDGQTGVLIHEDVNAASLAQGMLRLCTDAAAYQAMRVAVRQHSLENLAWDRVVQRMAEVVGVAHGGSHPGANAE